MKKPSTKTLSAVFSDPKKARAIFEMSRDELLQTDAGEAREKECYNPPKTYDLRMHALGALQSSFHGLETIKSTGNECADYLNAGDTYAGTIIYWRGRYRVQSLGDFIETMERQGVRFI